LFCQGKKERKNKKEDIWVESDVHVHLMRLIMLLHEKEIQFIVTNCNSVNNSRQFFYGLHVVSRIIVNAVPGFLSQPFFSFLFYFLFLVISLSLMKCKEIIYFDYLFIYFLTGLICFMFFY